MQNPVFHATMPTLNLKKFKAYLGKKRIIMKSPT